MTVNKVGRPSNAPERIAEILAATASVAARDGIANITMSSVAEAAGMQRTLVLHYFASRDVLVERFLAEAVTQYGATMLRRLRRRSSVRQQITAMVGPAAYTDPDDLILWVDLVALAGRDPRVRDRLRIMWTEHWLVELEHQLSEEYPTAPPGAISAAAYGLSCVFEAHWAFHLQGVGGAVRRRQAVAVATTILRGLEP